MSNEGARIKPEKSAKFRFIRLADGHGSSLACIAYDTVKITSWQQKEAEALHCAKAY